MTRFHYICFIVIFRFHGSSGLLKSKMDQTGSYSYEYDPNGRLVKAILPTGEALGLQFNLTSQGAAIDIMKNGIMNQVVLVQDQLVSKRPFGSDLRRHVVSVSSDKTLVSRRPDGLGLTVGTIPHPVIGVIGDQVMADSFPMAGNAFILQLNAGAVLSGNAVDFQTYSSSRVHFTALPDVAGPNEMFFQIFLQNNC